MNNEVTEIAKATQEVAKAARTGIEAAQGFGGFLAKVSQDKTLNGIVRSGFVDIIKQLEVVDVHILNYIYSDILERNLRDRAPWNTDSERDFSLDPIRYGVSRDKVQTSLEISRHIYECAVDNLLRVRCLAPYLEDIDVPGEYPDTASRVHEYELVSITPFGWDFVRSCTMPANSK